VEPLADGGFLSIAPIRALPRTGIMSFACSPTSFQRTRDLPDNDDIMLCIAQVNGFRSSQLDREAFIPSGGAVLLSAEHVGCTDWLTGGYGVSLRVSRTALAPLVRNIDDAIGRAVPAGTPTLQFLRRYIGLLEDARELEIPELKSLTAAHVHDLIALVIGANREAAEIARGRGVRAARLRAIKADIADNLRRPDLSVAAIAARQGVTPRYVQKLFEAAGTTFTAYVLAQRLAQARRMLIDPRYAARSVTSIAYDCGFGDLSHFTHRFRRCFGDTPSGMRDEARRQDRAGA
jgi:AraC-like DNA-binding protein